ncbi:MAG: PQQ-binding-like beta-propeller repeat protein [Dehalococcoidia bacterium]|nr:PQQ-binding-like beta-propeller repeat protein [Dehalococcoidia bacterium]
MILLTAACSSISTPEGWSAGVVKGDALIIGTAEGSLLAVDKINGSTLWRAELQASEDVDQAIYGKPAVADDAVYVGGYNGSLYVFDLQGQETKWGDQPLGGPIVGGPALVDDLVIVGTAAEESQDDGKGAVYAIDTESGDTVWRFPAEGGVWSSPTVADGVVYFGTLGQIVFAVSLEDGSELWRTNTGGAVVASPLVVGGRVYVGAFDSVFYALDAQTGNVDWKFTESERWYWTQALAAGNTIFAPSLDGNLYALDANTGVKLWAFESEGAIVGSPTIVSGMLAIPVSEGGNSKVHLVEFNGSQKDSCRIGENVFTTLVADGDLIYFAATDKSIRALSISGNGNPDEEWVYLTDKDDPLPRDRAKAC